MADSSSKTYADAAKNLGLAAGTVSSRLARARDLLRVRLLRRGLTLSSSLLVPVLAQQALSAAVPRALRVSITEAALRIAAGQTVLAGLISEAVAASTKETLQVMFVTKLQVTGLLLLVVCALSAAGMIGCGAWSEKWIDAPQGENPPQTAEKVWDKKQTKPEKRFVNAFGYSWLVPPADVAEVVAYLKTGHTVWIDWLMVRSQRKSCNDLSKMRTLRGLPQPTTSVVDSRRVSAGGRCALLP